MNNKMVAIIFVIMDVIFESLELPTLEMVEEYFG